MPDDLKISDMTPITGANLAADDVFPVVDISTSTNRSITKDELFGAIRDAEQTLTNKTINLANNTLIATSAQLAAAVTDETGTGALVFAGSPALTGTPTAPTAAAGTNTTQLATTAHVFAERTNAATLTDKTMTSPIINGGTITNAVIDGRDVGDDGAVLDALASAAALTFQNVTSFLTSAVLTSGMIGKRAWSQDGLAWDIVAAGTGDFDHPVTGVGLRIVPNSRGEIEWGATGAVAGGADHSEQWDILVAAMARVGTRNAVFGPGTWRFPYVTLPEGFTAVCARWLTIFEPVDADDRSIFTMDSGAPDEFLDGPRFWDATFKGIEVTPTFSEQKHLVALHGVDGVYFLGCRFIGWRGDALYFGSSDTGGTTERHNRNAHIYNCFFDGVNNENRQAISLIDMDGLYVRGCYFKNCTKSTMPGVIDLEPNSNAFHIIRNVWIEDNSFEYCGGNVGTICWYIQAAAPLPQNININRNKGRNLNLASGAGFVGSYLNITVDADDVDMAIKVNDNDVRDSVGRPYQLRGVKGFRAKGNVFVDMTLPPLFGFTAATDALRDVSICDTFIRVGSTEDSGIDIFTVTNIDLSGSSFEDVASGTGTTCAMNFKTGVSEGVKLNNISITSPTGKTTRAVIKDGGHTFTPGTNQHYGCDWGALVNAFQAHQSDSIWTDYTPVAEGVSTAGAGTYTRQYGRWRRIGKQVFFELEIVQSSHTGTGLLELSLPVQAAPSSNNELKPVAVMLDGVSTTGGQIGAINPATVAGGVTGCIRCYHTATGTIAQTAIPAGAATFRASGSYMAA